MQNNAFLMYLFIVFVAQNYDATAANVQQLVPGEHGRRWHFWFAVAGSFQFDFHEYEDNSNRH